MNSIIVSSFVAGLFFGSGPCIASCGPFLVSYVAGTNKNVSKGIAAYVLFSLARISVYIALGIGIFFLSSLAIENLLAGLRKYILLSGGLFMAVIGLLMVLGRRLDPGFCRALNRVLLENDKKSIFAVGLLIGLMPCLPLLSVLSYIGLVSRGWTQSALYSFSFGIGTFISPLILIVMLAGSIRRLFLFNEAKYRLIFNSICGMVIIFLGVQLMGRAF